MSVAAVVDLLRVREDDVLELVARVRLCHVGVHLLDQLVLAPAVTTALQPASRHSQRNVIGACRRGAWPSSSRLNVDDEVDGQVEDGFDQSSSGEMRISRQRFR